MNRALLVLLLAVPAAAAPDPQALARRAFELYEEAYSQASDWVYLERSISRTRDSNGKIKKFEDKTHKWIYLEGTPYRRLVAQNNQPVPEDEVKRQGEALEKTLEARGSQSQREREKRLKEHREKRENTIKALQEVPDAFEFRHSGEEVIRGRKAWRIEATPRPGYEPKTSRAHIFPKMRGRLWIDQETGNWIKLEAELMETFTVGWILVRIGEGATARLEQGPAGDLWQPIALSYQAGVRIGLIKFDHVETDITYSGWRREPAGRASR